MHKRIYLKEWREKFRFVLKQGLYMSRAILLIDPQNDFINGSLPVPGAEEAMNALAAWLLQNKGRYALKMISLDWHPWTHSSFQENGGSWPRHCVAFSRGSAVWPPLHDALHDGEAELAFLQKGVKAAREEYSIFQNEEAARRIASLVKKLRIRDVDICGLAGDVCVLNTLKDARSIGWMPKFHLLEEFTPSLDGGKALRAFMETL